MAINLYSKASVDSLLSGKLSISSLSNAATTTLNATAPTTGQVLSFDGTDLKWVTPAGGATWGSITGTLSSQTDLNTALNARVSTAGDTMDNNALLEFNDTFNSTHLGIDGNGVTVENAGLGISANLNKDDLVFTDGVDTASIGLAGVTFADGTTQTTAYTGGGGTLVGDQISIYTGYLYNETTSTFVTALTLDGASTVNARNITLQLSGGGALTFSDGTTMTTKPYGLPVGGTTGQVLSKINSADYNVQWSTPSGGGVDVQTFGDASTSGSFTWTKPAGAKWVEILLFGGGGGGGSGARQATTSIRGGGGGGGGAPFIYSRVGADFLGSTETVVVGAGGSGGASVTTDNTNGTSASAATASSFANFKTGFGGAGGGGSSTAGGTAGGGVNGLVFAVSSTSGNGTAGAFSGNAANGSGNSGSYISAQGGGGAAGAAASSTTSANGGNGGSFTAAASNATGNSASIAGGSGGVGSTSTQATAGTSATTRLLQAGTGGGGGFYRTGVAGGTGANGGWPGGGGGGGGASDNGNASGAGGNGGNGLAVIITYF